MFVVAMLKKLQPLAACIPACIPTGIIQLQATENMEAYSLPRAPKLRKVLLSKAFFFACRKAIARTAVV